MKVKQRHLRDLSDQRAKQGTRLLAIDMLQDAEAAFGRLSRGADDEALHDFRVALRRLRSHLRTYREWLSESISRKQERRLRRIARASNPSRDLEVLLDRLDEIEKPTAEESAGIEALKVQFGEQLARRRRKFREEALHDFPALSRTLRVRLTTYIATIELDRSTEEALGSVAARLAAGLRGRLNQDLEAIASIEHQEEAHDARIAGKELRYLFQPFTKEHPECEEAVAALRLFQDALGHLHDAHVLLTGIEGALSAAGAEEQIALAAVHERVREQRADIFKGIRRDYIDSGAGLLQDAILGAERGIMRARQFEIERKFLLKRFPRVRDSAAVTITQGYLPGKDIKERVRLVESETGKSYFRTLKGGRGLTRIEIEEETTEEVFKRLFGLTKGRRVRKRRYRVQENGVTWEIDRFLDRKLVIAEVELESANGPVTLPNWLRTVLDREITGEDEYDNSELAK